ncbi:hypothetical protein ACIA8O_02180 [Kitasatospora sp. NPDC051853]|uniref:hypothetical protein n=1 Tax=Kitasatospora sp. NPDC051853 TaxID=3364058 RepID=UPI0037A0FF86
MNLIRIHLSDPAGQDEHLAVCLDPDAPAAELCQADVLTGRHLMPAIAAARLAEWILSLLPGCTVAAFAALDGTVRACVRTGNSRSPVVAAPGPVTLTLTGSLIHSWLLAGKPRTMCFTIPGHPPMRLQSDGSASLAVSLATSGACSDR